MMSTVAESPATPRPPGPNAPHAVVIGSGFGGLAGAARLAARGYRVTVLERLDAPGGRAYVFRQDGFSFDAGPTMITIPFVLEELWSFCGRRFADDIDLRQISPFYQIRFHDGSVFTYGGTREDMYAEIERFAPGDLEGYKTFMTASEGLYRTGFEKMCVKPFDTLWDMAQFVPELIKREGWRSVYGLAAKHVKNEKLRMILSFHPLFIGGNPFQVTAIYGMITYLEQNWGVYFPIGGTGALVKGMVGLIEGLGGTVRTKAEVTEITVEGKRATGVKLSSGEVIPAEIVVSNADAAWTYQQLVPASARRRWTDAKLNKTKYSPSLFVWYFGTRRQYPEVGHHNIIMGPRYRELLRDIFAQKILADDFSLYLHRPTATDPGLAPEGCDTFYVLSPVPNLQAGIDWSVEAEAYRKKIESFLEQSLLPGLSQEIVTSRVVTPQDFRNRLLSVQGAAFSLEPVLTQTGWFRPHNRSEELERLFLVGAGTHPGAGVPGVVSSARVLDLVVPDATDLV